MKQSATAIPLSWTNIEMSIEQFSSHLSDASFSKIDTDPVGQRPDIESMSKREGIINVIFRGYDFGELKLRTLTEPIRQATAFKYRSIDGGHRKRAIRDFIANKFKTGSYTATYINGEEINIGNKYYKDLRTMATIIAEQNADILNAWEYYDGILVNNNQQLASMLGLEASPAEYQQNYAVADLKVKVI